MRGACARPPCQGIAPLQWPGKLEVDSPAVGQAPATPPQGAGGSMSAARSAGASDAPQPARGEGAVPFWAIEGEAEKVNW